jgi:hypothetical protein
MRGVATPWAATGGGHGGRPLCSRPYSGDPIELSGQLIIINFYLGITFIYSLANGRVGRG